MQESNLRQLESKSSALPAELIHNGKTIPLSQTLSRRRTTRDRNALPKALVERGSAEHGTAGTTCTTAPTGMPVGGLELKGLYCWGRKAKRPGDPCGASEPFSLTVWSAGRYSLPARGCPLGCVAQCRPRSHRWPGGRDADANGAKSIDPRTAPSRVLRTLPSSVFESMYSRCNPGVGNVQFAVNQRVNAFLHAKNGKSSVNDQIICIWRK